MGLLDSLLSLQPRLLWSMDHASGLPVDVSGNGKNATNIFGTVTPRYGPVVPASLGARTPQSAAAVSNGYGIPVASIDSWASGQPMTWSFWAVLNATPTVSSMVGGRRKSGLFDSIIYIATTRNPTFYLLNGSAPAGEEYFGFQSSSGVNWLWPIGQWTMVTITIDASNLVTIYVNGVVMGFDFYSPGTTHIGYRTSATSINRNNSGDYFMAGGGGLDTFGTPDMTYGPVALWNRALSANEVKQLADAGFSNGVALGMGGYGG